MNLKIKKRLAKEFLLIILTIVLGVLFFLCIYSYNYYQNYQIKNLDYNIVDEPNKIDNYLYFYNRKSYNQTLFFTKFSEKVSLPGTLFDTSNKLWSHIEEIEKKDSIKKYWENKWSKKFVGVISTCGFDTPDKFI